MKAMLNNIFQKLRNPTSALRQVTFVAGGVIVAQALNVFILPVISRLYAPADYGVMAVFSSIVAILSEVSGLRYFLAIPLPKQERYAFSLAGLSLIVQGCFVGLLSIVLCLFGDPILNIVSMHDLIPYKYLIPLGLLGVGIYNILTQLCIRKGIFNAIGKTKITQCLLGAATKIGLGALGLKPIGLLVGTIVSQAGGITTLGASLLHTIGNNRCDRSMLRRVAIKYRKFPLYNTWYGLLNVFGTQLPSLLLSSFYSFKVVGFYAMASSIMTIPTTFVGQAIGQIFIQRASIARHDGNIARVSIRAYTILLEVGFFPILFVSFIAPPVFSVVLGQRWGAAGTYTILLIPFIAYNFAYSPLSMLYLILDRHEVSLIHEVTYISLRAIAFMIGTIWKNPLVSVALYAITCFFVQFYRVVYLLKTAGNPSRIVIFHTIQIITEAILIFTPVLICYFVNVNIIILLSVAVMSIIFYLLKTYRTLHRENIV